MRIDTSQDYFVSDPHFGHELMRRLRGFETIKEMDQVLVDAWNGVVWDGDRVICLGDFCLGGLRVAREYFARLNGTISILCNMDHHDKRWLRKFVDRRNGHFDKTIPIDSKSGIMVKLLPPLWSIDLDEREEYRKKIVLCHFPIQRWNLSHYGSWHLHGHSHGKLSSEGMLRMDVSVDALEGFAPISLEEIKTEMKRREEEGVNYRPWEKD